MDIRKIIVASESQHSWEPSLKYGFSKKQKKELAQYLPTPEQCTNLFFELSNSANELGINTEFLVIENVNVAIEKIRTSIDEKTCVWVISDGRKFHLSSPISAWLNTLGIYSYGIDTTIQSLTDNKYLMSVIAQKHGISIPKSYLYKADREIAMVEGVDHGDGFFVKPNNLGSQIGISTKSKASSFVEAESLSTEIYECYGVDSIIQAYIQGIDHRISVIETSKSGLEFGCSKITVVSDSGEVQPHSTNRLVNNRKWLLETVNKPNHKANITAKNISSMFYNLGFIQDYAGIDIRGTEKSGYVFLENNVKPFVDGTFNLLAKAQGFKSKGDMFIDSITREN